MRTTIEITDEQHRALLALAGRRRMRGFSPLVQEAIDLYLAREAPEELDEVLALEASITDEQAAEIERRIDEAWATWSVDR